MALARKERLFKTTLLVTFVIILSKVTGFLRDMIMAKYFGTGIANDAYVSAYSLFYLPVLLFSSCISATLIPLFMQEKQQNGLDRANHFASNSLNLFAVAALAVSALMYALAGPLVHIIYPGFDAEKTLLTVQLTRIMMLGLCFNVASLVLTSLLNAADKFMAAQLTGFPLNFSVMFAAIVLSGKYGVQAVAWGVFVSCILQVVIQVPFMRGWFKYYPTLDYKDKRFRRLLILAGPALLSMGISELNHMIDHALASTLNSGDISAMSYAYRLVQFLQGVALLPLTTIMFSRMSRMVAQNNERGVLDMLRHCVLVIALVLLPVVAIAVILSTDVIKFAYMRGAFNMDSVRVTAGVLIFYVIGVPFFGMRDFLNRLFHSLQDTKTPFRVACLVVATNITLNLILKNIMGANGLALATSIAGFVGTIVMFFLLRKQFKHLGFMGILVDLIKGFIATAVCAAVCIGMNYILPEAFGTVKVFLRLAAATAVSLIVYAVCCYILNIRVFREFIGGFLRRASK